jgi:hypothetical protein
MALFGLQAFQSPKSIAILLMVDLIGLVHDMLVVAHQDMQFQA